MVGRRIMRSGATPDEAPEPCTEWTNAEPRPTERALPWYQFLAETREISALCVLGRTWLCDVRATQLRADDYLRSIASSRRLAMAAPIRPITSRNRA